MQPKEKKRSRKEQGLNPVPLLFKRQLWPPGHLKLRDCLIQPITANAKNEETTSKWLVFDQNSGRRHRRQFKFNRDFVVVSSTTSLSSASSTTSSKIGATLRGEKGSKGGWSCSRRLAASRLLWHLIPSEEKKNYESWFFEKKNTYPWNITWV